MRLHPATAVENALELVAAGVGAALLLRPAVAAVDLPEWVVVAASALLVVGAVGYAVARYLAFDYEVRADTLAVRSGVLLRRDREIPLGRVQSVDVTQSVFARAFGLAAVRVETAGGGATEAELAYVSDREAERLRRVLRAADAATGERAAGEGPDAEGTVLFELPARDLALLSLVSFRWGTVPALLLGAPVLGSVLLSLVVDLLADLGGLATALAALLVGIGGVVVLIVAYWLASAVRTAVRYWGFTLRRAGDELRYERGLFERYAGTIPLGKVQALTVEENVAMRPLEYAALSVETAGYAPGESGRAPSAVPLADREEVLDLVASLSDVEDLAVERPPARARRRYAVRYTVVLAALSAVLLAARLAVGTPQGWFAPLVALPLVLPAARRKWANRGHRLDDDGLVTRDGYWSRTTRVVPYYRVQTVVETRTVFQRRRDLASVTADTAGAASLLGGDATAHDVDARTARLLHRALRDRLQADLRGRRARTREGTAGTDEDAASDADGTDEDAASDADGTDEDAATDVPADDDPGPGDASGEVDDG